MLDLLIVDDHTIFRAGLARLLEEEPDIGSVTEATDAAGALAAVREAPFDLVLLDINLPVKSGLDLLPTLRKRAPHLPVLILSMYSAEQYALRSFEAGARGYVSKDMDADELTTAIRKVAVGGRYVIPAVAEQMLQKLDAVPGDAPHEQLSERELEVMMRLAAGHTLTRIGEDLHLSVKTVSTYRSRTLTKLGLESNADLVRYALTHRLID